MFNLLMFINKAPMDKTRTINFINKTIKCLQACSVRHSYALELNAIISMLTATMLKC